MGCPSAAFLPSSFPIHATPRQKLPLLSRRPQCRPFTPHMLSFTSIATEIVAVAAISAGTYYFLRDEDEGSPKSERKDQQPRTPTQGILGLSSTAAETTTTPSLIRSAPPPPTAPAFDSVGVDINDYMETILESPTAGRRVAEELAWAAASLSDIQAIGGVVVADSAGDVVWVDGPLVGETQQLGRVVERVAQTKKMELFTEGVEGLFPFLKKVAEVAVLPVGTEGAVLVLASEETQFFGVVEERIAKAVASRLASFLRIPPQIGA